MKILYIVPWSIPFEESNLQDIVNTQFGYYTLKNKSADITWFTLIPQHYNLTLFISS